MKKRILSLLLAALLLTGCAPSQRYRVVDYSLFDTVTTVMTARGKQSDFEKTAAGILEDLRQYHRLFDIYQEYEGLVNLKTLNDQAGLRPQKVDPELMAFLLDCREYHRLTGGRVNPAMGAVLSLWHQAREDSEAHLPDLQALTRAADHCRMEDLILDPEENTVFYRDPELKLDVGAVAKGWALERVCRKAPPGLLISVGGNVKATGPKGENTPWVVGIQDPDTPGAYLKNLPLSHGSAVTSGDYQRYFMLDGKRYHHIIDPDTGYPGELWRSVTICTEDSGLADCLSTALFLLDREQGQALLDQTGSEALWVSPSGEIFMSPGFPK